jgi:hypothetical protein
LRLPFFGSAFKKVTALSAAIPHAGWNACIPGYPLLSLALETCTQVDLFFPL